MINIRFLRGFAAATSFIVAGCNSLDVQNPNEPDNKRALADPSAIEAVAAGTINTWVNAFNSYNGTLVEITQARSFSSSWNNANMYTYDRIDNPSDPPDQWTRLAGG